MLPTIPEGLANAIDTTTKAAKEFLEKIAGPSAEEFGLFLGDKIRRFRFEKQVKLLADAQEILKQAVISSGQNAGTYIYINSIPSAGKAPYFGGGYWVQLPTGGLGVWT